MGRILSLLASMLIFGLAACGDPTASYQEETVSVDGKPGTLALGTAEFDNNMLAVLQVRDSDGRPIMEASGSGSTWEGQVLEITGLSAGNILAARSIRPDRNSFDVKSVADARADPVSNVDVNNQNNIRIGFNGRGTVTLKREYAELPRVTLRFAPHLTTEERHEIMRRLQAGMTS